MSTRGRNVATRRRPLSIGPFNGERQIVWDRLTACSILLNLATLLGAGYTGLQRPPLRSRQIHPSQKRSEPARSAPCGCGINLRLLTRDFAERSASPGLERGFGSAWTGLLMDLRQQGGGEAGYSARGGSCEDLPMGRLTIGMLV